MRIPKDRVWPTDPEYRARYFVPDLTPEQRRQLRRLRPRVVFVAESPHKDEVCPEREGERRPLCGKAGVEWWKTIGGIIGDRGAGTGLDRQLDLCRNGKFVVLNAVQYPLNQGIKGYYGRGADPVMNLGFAKKGSASFRKREGSPGVKNAIRLLQRRLKRLSGSGIKFVPLGEDAEWFLNLATDGSFCKRLPHPSSWWRKPGRKEEARERLKRLLSHRSYQKG